VKSQDTSLEPSLKRRYAYKLGARFLAFFTGFITAGLVPRALGPAAYGIFGFLQDFFTRLIQFFDFGSAEGFYTKISRRPNDTGLISFYALYLLLITICIAIFFGIVHIFSLESRIWPGQDFQFIAMAALLAILFMLKNVASKIMDAYALTIPAEKIGLINNIVAALLIIGLFYSQKLTLTTYFLYHYWILGVVVSIYLYIFWRKKLQSGMTQLRLSWPQFKSYAKEFYVYCNPLVLVAIVSLVSGIFDRWFLQSIDGNITQGLYSLSYRISQICFMFTSALTPLFMRELSLAFGKNDLAGVRRLFRRYIPLLFSLTAYFSCFIAFQAKNIIFFFGGVAFQGAVLPMMIMALYPMSQTYGDLTASVFIAKGQTKLFRNIVVSNIVFGMILTYLFVAPKSWWGLELGALGLSLKMVLYNFVFVNTYLFFNARDLKLSFRRYFGHQIGLSGILLTFSWVTSTIVATFISNSFLAFFVSGFSYSLLVLILVLTYPLSFGLFPHDIRKGIQRLIHPFRKT